MHSPFQYLSPDLVSGKTYFESSYSYDLLNPSLIAQVSQEKYFTLSDKLKPVNHMATNIYIDTLTSSRDDYSSYFSINNNIYGDIFTSKSTDLVFPGLRYYSDGIIIFERPPFHKVIDCSATYRDSINHNTPTFEYYLPIPWQVYIATYNPDDMRLVDVRMFFSNSSLYSFDQTLYAPPLFNFYANGRLCRPFFSSMEDIEKYPKDIAGVMASAYDWIWNSGFNFDITENISEFIVTKKYEQFFPYLDQKNKKLIFNYNWLKEHPIHSYIRQIPESYIKVLYNLWQSVSLSEISQINWNNVLSEDFLSFALENQRENLVDSYISKNSLIVHEYSSEDGYDYHTDNCSSECIYYNDIFESNDFIKYTFDTLRNTPQDLKHLLIAARQFAFANGIIKNPNLYSKSSMQILTPHFSNFALSYFSS